MSLRLKNHILIFITIILVVIFTPFFGSLYEKIIGHKLSSGFWGPSNPKYIPGFLLSYALFVSLFGFTFASNNRFKLFGFLLLVIFLIELFFGIWDIIIYSIGLIIISWLLAQIIKFLYKKFKK